MRFRIFHHLIDLGIGEPRGCSNGNLLLLAGRGIFGSHIKDTVCVNIKRYFDLRYTSRCGWQFAQAETSDRFVVNRLFPFALKDMHIHRGLIVHRRREGIRFFGRNRCVPVNQPREHPTERFNPK